MSDEQAQLLSWNTKSAQNLIQCYGNQLSFSGNKPDIIKTSQVIPDALNSFSFSISFKNKLDHVDVSVGFDFHDQNYIMWWKNGELDDGNGIVADLESFKKNDFIELHLHKINVGIKSFNYVKFFKNKNLCGARIVDCKYSRPIINIIPVKDDSTTVDIETSFSNITSFEDKGKVIMKSSAYENIAINVFYKNGKLIENYFKFQMFQKPINGKTNWKKSQL